MAVTGGEGVGPAGGRAVTVRVSDAHVYYRVYEEADSGAKALFSQARASRRHRTIRAVQGVSLELYESETLGLIGPNGSGKTTLLSAMTGLLPLQSGSIVGRSRPSLLGVSSALRPALSGRRNILIGGLALGFTKAEIQSRSDEIIDFSGLRDAIDRPMRTYSSGMRARLHFAIATARIPDVLLIDEALSVGDEDFRRRSAERIAEIRAATGSVVLVTHIMAEIERHCDRVAWLDGGILRAAGDPGEVVAAYLESTRLSTAPAGSAASPPPVAGAGSADGVDGVEVGTGGGGVSGDVASEAAQVAARRDETRERFVEARNAELPLVSVLLGTRRPDRLESAVASVASQNYPRLELVLAPHGDGFDGAEIDRVLQGAELLSRVVPCAAELTLGEVLNAATEAASGELLTKFDDDDRYGVDHVWDLVLAQDSSEAPLVGKAAEFVHLSSNNVTLRRWAGGGERYVTRQQIAGGALLITAACLEEVSSWRPVPSGVDKALIEDVLAAGHRVYRTHGFGYVLVRHGEGHAWNPDDQYFLDQANETRPGLDLAFSGVTLAVRPS